ncbi:hypothetical protein CSHISOI_00596 [Colletotrichum shisoi]|uniref:Uncharacterized protein n=1 Tax=Colletotrichum shisoi TaxID=2078593 RepID=A0A5Q4C639_9PEZI|nr:hypothetical protein CSHISOI_00596 [Colletotrichum shisoi]
MDLVVRCSRRAAEGRRCVCVGLAVGRIALLARNRTDGIGLGDSKVKCRTAEHSRAQQRQHLTPHNSTGSKAWRGVAWRGMAVRRSISEYGRRSSIGGRGPWKKTGVRTGRGRDEDEYHTHARGGSVSVEQVA